VVLLLERIAEEMKCEADREIVMQYAKRIKSSAWAEIVRELF